MVHDAFATSWSKPDVTASQILDTCRRSRIFWRPIFYSSSFYYISAVLFMRVQARVYCGWLDTADVIISDQSTIRNSCFTTLPTSRLCHSEGNVFIQTPNLLMHLEEFRVSRVVKPNELAKRRIRCSIPLSLCYTMPLSVSEATGKRAELHCFIADQRPEDDKYGQTMNQAVDIGILAGHLNK